MRYLLILFLALISQQINAQLKCKEYNEVLLTHLLTPAGPVPTAYDANGVYPYNSYCETTNRSVPKNYRMVALENDLIKVIVCPDLGGKVVSMIHKKSGKEVLYNPGLVRQTRILPRFYFVAGGIEVSFPISHSPSQNDPVSYKIDKTKNRIYVTCGQRELHFGMQFSVEYSLGSADSFLTQRAVYFNPGKNAYPWMSWSNAALPSAPDTKYDFPKGKVLTHASKIDSIVWTSKTEQDIKEMTGFFWKTKDVNAFGAFTSSLGVGLYHVADKSAPGIKLWSYGVKNDKNWALLSTARKEPYIEIQAGPISNQSIKLELQPNEKRNHVEFWFPTDMELDINQLQVPQITIRSINEIPLFDWSTSGEVKLWNNLTESYKAKMSVPSPPDPILGIWAPSGMENLDEPFTWAINKSYEGNKDIWAFHYGAWLAGRNKIDKSIAILLPLNSGISKALLARLQKKKGDWDGARKSYELILDQWLLLHPQVVIERDKLLRSIGKSTLDERGKWLEQVDALKDEWIIARKIQWLIDKERFEDAKVLLLSTPFQKVHQTYTRTGLWKQITKRLNIPFYPIPESLGEDQLAVFGAYREYE